MAGLQYLLPEHSTPRSHNQRSDIPDHVHLSNHRLDPYKYHGEGSTQKGSDVS